MATQQQIQENIDALEEALASGADSVTIDGRTVQYKGATEILRSLEYFKAQLDTPEIKRPTIRRILM